MIKCAHLTASVSRRAGGLFDAILHQVKAHDRQKITTRVFGLWDEFTEADRKEWLPVSVMAFKSTTFQSLGYSPRFARELRAFAPDLIHTHGLWLYPSAAAGKYSRRKKRPRIISPHGMLDPWALKNSRWKKRLAYALFERAHLRGARCLRALCAAEAQAMRQFGLKNAIAIIPNGVDLPEPGAPTWTVPWQGRMTPGRKVMLFLSRIHPKKGLVNLLRAWGRTAPPDWVLAIAGWDQGGHEANLKRLCTELKIPIADARNRPAVSVENRPFSVMFLGPQFEGNKAACYHHCDAFILPSFSEGLPMVVLEAWANAKPVLMTPECNLPEGFQSGAALKLEATEAGVAAGLDRFFRLTEAERIIMGNHARDLAKERFTWTQIGRQMESVYDWMLGGGAKPGCLADF